MENPDILIFRWTHKCLDADAIGEFHKILLDEKEKGKIVLLASHNREDIDILCDKVFVMEKGVLTKR